MKLYFQILLTHHSILEEVTLHKGQPFMLANLFIEIARSTRSTAPSLSKQKKSKTLLNSEPLKVSLAFSPQLPYYHVDGGNMNFQQATNKISTLADNIEKVIFGKREAILQVIAAFICNEHILIEDRPGVGKSRLIAAMAKSIDASFNRIQFTPDILPSDITGVTIYNPGKQEFVFRAGPVFNQIIMADELNRTPPRTQSCLLEVMEEHQTTVDGTTHILPEPFMVLASQNPVNYEGTYPLPEAQLDRFLMCISLGYPDPEIERNIIKTYGISDPLTDLKSVLSTDNIIKMQGVVKKIEFNDELNGYIQTLLTKSREHPDVHLGISPRGGIALAKAARAWALISARDYVIPDDIKKMALPVFRHRLLTKQTLTDNPRTAEDIIQSICEETPVPVL